MKTVLFDMDGTLTEPRQKMEIMMSAAIAKLQKSGFRVGIVTGSDLNYIKDQCQILFDFSPVDYTQIDFYPCNGTKHYTFLHNEIEHYSNSMRSEMGVKLYNDLIYALCDIQGHFRYQSWAANIPLTGNFIDCRGSMINYCPIGRNASEKERDIWISLDRKFNIRKNILDMHFPDNGNWSDLSIKMGGETSFDITPESWNKTYVLRNFKELDEVWFIGDRCEKDGNDKELYDAIKLRLAGDSFKTSGPSKTMEIINDRILQYPANSKR